MVRREKGMVGFLWREEGWVGEEERGKWWGRGERGWQREEKTSFGKQEA